MKKSRLWTVLLLSVAVSAVIVVKCRPPQPPGGNSTFAVCTNPVEADCPDLNVDTLPCDCGRGVLISRDLAPCHVRSEAGSCLARTCSRRPGKVTRGQCCLCGAVVPSEIHTASLEKHGAGLRRDFVPMGDPALGKELLAERRCLHCHSIRGSGGGLAPDLAAIPVDMGFLSVVAEFWSHIPGMRRELAAEGRELSFLSPTEVRDLIVYLLNVRLQPQAGGGEEDAGRSGVEVCLGCHAFTGRGSARHGRAVFVAKGCAQCHKKAGIATALTASAARESPSHFAWAAWNRAPRMAEALASRGRDWPQLTAVDIRDILAFLREQ